jgi:hypothetical protein
MKHVKLFEEYVNESAFDEVKSMYEKSLIPVPDLHFYVTKTPMGGPQLLDTTKYFLEIFGKEWRMPTDEELDELLERKDELGLEKPFTGDSENIWSYRYWVTNSNNSKYAVHVGQHIFDSTTGESYAFYIKDFSEAEKQKFFGAKHGKQYGI